CDSGFVPGTLCEDGDPLDVWVMTDGPTAPGVLFRVRLLGILLARQQEHRAKAVRNDRLIGVAESSARHTDVKTLSDLGDGFLAQLDLFFAHYNQFRGKRFQP